MENNMAAIKKSSKNSDNESPKVWCITSQRDGFRRAGLVWTTKPIVLAKEALTDEQLALLQAEALLTVEEVDAPVVADDAGDAE
jgi:Mu-like prophage FluMu N-terminal domain